MNIWSVEEQLAGKRQPTQFGRTLDQLRRHLHRRHSPQAKGRVERSGACCRIACAANSAWLLLTTSTPPTPCCVASSVDYNRRFAKTPREMETAWRTRAAQPRPRLLLRARAHCQQRQRRAVGRRRFQIPTATPPLQFSPVPKCRSIKLLMAGSPSTTATPAWNTKPYQGG